jgi:hypothetical protein
MTDAEQTLYQAPFEEFVATRDRLAAELKAGGDKAAATALSKQKRPSISAWAVNQLWWHARSELDALFATAARLRGGDLAASSSHRDVLARLRAHAAKLLGDGGHPANEATLRRVTGTLSAIAANGGFDPDPAGALVKDRDPPGFEALAGMPLVEPAVAEPPKPKSSPKPVDDSAERLERERVEAEAEAKRQRLARERLKSELRAAQVRATAATRAVDAARRTLADVERELAEAQAAVASLEAELATTDR